MARGKPSVKDAIFCNCESSLIWCFVFSVEVMLRSSGFQDPILRTKRRIAEGSSSNMTSTPNGIDSDPTRAESRVVINSSCSPSGIQLSTVSILVTLSKTMKHLSVLDIQLRTDVTGSFVSSAKVLAISRKLSLRVVALWAFSHSTEHPPFSCRLRQYST